MSDNWENVWEKQLSWKSVQEQKMAEDRMREQYKHQFQMEINKQERHFYAKLDRYRKFVRHCRENYPEVYFSYVMQNGGKEMEDL